MSIPIILVDHYDSFTQNVLDWLDPGDGAFAVERIAFDDAKSMRSAASGRSPLVFSPGPKRPEDAQPSLALIQQMQGKVPILGICLGHQLLALANGARIVRAKDPFHGSRRTVTRLATVDDLSLVGLLGGLPSEFEAAVYNSLCVEESSLPAGITVLAKDADGEIQALAINSTLDSPAPAWGLQFHPESYLSEEIRVPIRANWLAVLRRFGGAL